jgi:thiosulfate dehydrogenase (quinone) large subunit
MAQPHRKQPARPRLRTAPRVPNPITPAVTTATLIPGTAILPLRLFLGLTFLYAAFQKVTDPGFFTLGAPTYIGTQLHGFAQGSPISFILLQMSAQAVAIGWLTILTEFAIGALTLLGLFTRPAALAGLVLNFMFFLSASWHTTPYFYGSDIVFVMCWTTLAIAGPGGFALDRAAAVWVSRRLPPELRTPLVLGLLCGPLAEETVDTTRETAPHQADARIVRVTRSEVVGGGILAAILIYLGLVPRGRTAASAASSGPTTKGATRSASGGAPPGMHRVANVAHMQPNSAVGVTDPKTGDPAAIVKLPNGSIVCYDAVCTHAGCIVEYDSSYKLLVCPCHGGAYDPAHGAAVVAGPPPVPLTQIPIQVNAAGDAFIA